MNPFFQALTGNSTPMLAMGGQTVQPMMNGPLGVLQGAIQRANQIASGLQNPQQLVNQYFPDAPEEIRNDPGQIVNWLQQTGRVNPQMIQTARQLMGR